MAEHNESISTRSLRALKWNALGTGFHLIAQVVGQIGLARLLGPETIGTFGYVLLLAGIASLLIDQGLGSALVQAQRVDHRQRAIAQSRLLLASLASAALTFTFADELAILLGAPGSAPLLRAFAPAFPLYAATVIAQADLRRQLRFREIQIAQNVSYAIGYVVVGLSLAATGQGALSLVAAWMTQAAIAAVMLHRYAGSRISFGNPFARLACAAYGRDIVSINAINWTVDNAMTAFIGKTLGAASLGIYNASLALVRTPANQLVMSLHTVLFPTAALVQAELHQARRLYLTALAALTLAAFPMFTLAAVVADTVVVALLGEAWRAAGPILVPLALAMLPHVLSSVAGGILTGIGSPHLERNSQFIILALFALSFALLSDAGLQTVCWAFLGIYLARALLLTKFAVARVQASIADVWEAVRGAVLSAVVVASTAATWIVVLDRFAAAHPMLRLISAAGMALLALVILALWLPHRLLSTHLLHLAQRLCPAQGATRRWVERATRRSADLHPMGSR